MCKMVLRSTTRQPLEVAAEDVIVGDVPKEQSRRTEIEVDGVKTWALISDENNQGKNTERWEFVEVNGTALLVEVLD